MVDESDNTAMHLTSFYNQLETLKFLLKNKNEFILNSRNNLGLTPLHTACNEEENLEVIELLIADKANVNAQNDEGRTSLHLACLRGDVETTKFLLGAHVKSCTTDSHTPWHYASSKMCEQIPELYPGNKVISFKKLIHVGIGVTLGVMFIRFLSILMYQLGLPN